MAVEAVFERLEQLLVNRPEWRYALAASRLGIRFERACIQFWDDIAEEHSADERTTGKEG